MLFLCARSRLKTCCPLSAVEAPHLSPLQPTPAACLCDLEFARSAPHQASAVSCVCRLDREADRREEVKSEHRKQLHCWEGPYSWPIAAEDQTGRGWAVTAAAGGVC